MTPRTTAGNRAPRVAYVTSSRGVGGAEQLIAALVAAGHKRGWNQIVLNPFADAASVVLAQRVALARYEGRECSNVLQLPGLRSWLARRLAQFQPDIVHVTLFHATVLTASLRRQGERWLLTHVYGEALLQLAHPRTRMRLDRWAGRRFDHVSAISNAVQEFLVRSHGYPPPEIGRIRLGWQGQPQARKPAANRDPTIVCVAVLRPEKGHDTLITAFEQVRREVPRARLVLVGDGPYRPQVEEMVRSAGLGESVQMMGRAPDIWPHLADADVFALASDTEALGIAIMEAMAAGLPVVASNVGGIPELVTPGVTGELFTPRNHGELAGKLIGLLKAPDRLSAMSAAARKAAEAMRMEDSIAKYFDLYDRLLKDGGAPVSGQPLVEASSPGR